jgi:hypothetical protein
MSFAENIDLAADPTQGYFVDYNQSPNTSSTFSHQFCGPYDAEGASCPNCRKPLLRFFGLDTRDSRLSLRSDQPLTLSLLFCWTCNVAQETFFYRDFNGTVEILQYGQGGVQTDFPYEDYPLFFPHGSMALEAITADEQAILNRMNRRFETGEPISQILGQRRDLWCVRHQIGGAPFLTQELAVLECPLYGVEMPFLASVANDCLDTRGLAGDDGVQVLYHYCRKCCVVGVYQMVD